MLEKVRSSDVLLPVRIVQRKDGGTDIWLRRNIKGPLTELVEGFSNTFYDADEAFMRTEKAVSAQEVEADFDGYWTRAVAYDPRDGIRSLSDRERIAQLERQNAMLTECLLEMSGIVYG